MKRITHILFWFCWMFTFGGLLVIIISYIGGMEEAVKGVDLLAYPLAGAVFCAITYYMADKLKEL